MIKREWIFTSEIISPSGEKHKTYKSKIPVVTNNIVNDYYMLETESEVVKGQWKYKLHHKGKNIYTRHFDIE